MVRTTPLGDKKKDNLYTYYFGTFTRQGWQTLNFHFHTFPFIFKYSFTSERMDIHTLLYLSFILQSFIICLNIFIFEDEVCKMNEKYTNVSIFIRSMNGNVGNESLEFGAHALEKKSWIPTSVASCSSFNILVLKSF